MAKARHTQRGSLVYGTRASEEWLLVSLLACLSACLQWNVSPFDPTILISIEGDATANGEYAECYFRPSVSEGIMPTSKCIHNNLRDARDAARYSLQLDEMVVPLHDSYMKWVDGTLAQGKENPKRPASPRNLIWSVRLSESSRGAQFPSAAANLAIRLIDRPSGDVPFFKVAAVRRKRQTGAEPLCLYANQDRGS
ncbi:hypothetical protein BGW80DRAFT_1257852 [Lactifluus volemus]|nr:hypothetical protein BGW80DRAFT_1257852 [Lactifluus volemus]